jgi:hypothetical protein
MKTFCCAAALAALCLASTGLADQPEKADPVRYEVPYRLTVPKHIMVRAKINGKGPFNFILDTGAPAVFITNAVAKKAGVEVDKNGWGSFDRFEIEGGVVVPKTRGRVEDLFQLEGMNGLGLAGAELHGVIGYNVLARYRIEIDFNSDKLGLTPLDWQPMAPMGLGGKGGGAGGLEIIGTLMKFLGGVMGKKAAPDYVARGFLGIGLEDKNEVITVTEVLADGPAGKSGLQPGDVVVKFQGRTVLDVEDVQRFARKLRPGDAVKLTVRRDGQVREITFKVGEGL